MTKGTGMTRNPTLIVNHFQSKLLKRKKYQLNCTRVIPIKLKIYKLKYSNFCLFVNLQSKFVLPIFRVKVYSSSFISLHTHFTLKFFTPNYSIFTDLTLCIRLNVQVYIRLRNPFRVSVVVLTDPFGLNYPKNNQIYLFVCNDGD